MPEKQTPQAPPSREEQAAYYERQYTAFVEAADRVVTECQSLMQSPDVRQLMVNRMPWIPTWKLKEAIDDYQEAQRLLLDPDIRERFTNGG